MKVVIAGQARFAKYQLESGELTGPDGLLPDTEDYLPCPGADTMDCS